MKTSHKAERRTRARRFLWGAVFSLCSAVVSLFFLFVLAGCGFNRAANLTQIGAPCSSDGDCESGLCLGDLPGGYCSQLCGGTEGCPRASSCVPQESGASFCLEDCRDASGCRNGYACREGHCDPICDNDLQCNEGE